MPPQTFPRDRFDAVVGESGRVGAHRAENPRLRSGPILLWAALATIVLIAVGIFGTLILSGRISLVSTPSPTSAPQVTIAPVVDTGYVVLILNATTEQGLATRVKDTVVAAGWSSDMVFPSEAASTDFEHTTVYFVDDGDASAAAGLADVIGGAQIAQSDQYQPVDDPDTDDDEGAVRQLTIVLGLDRDAAAESSAPAP